MRRIVCGLFDSPNTYACVDVKTMANVETGEAIDRKYWMPQYLVSSQGDLPTTQLNEVDVYWNKCRVEIYEDFDLDNEPEEGYELVCQNETRKIFKRICR